jgi:Protein of unknown function (DUF 659)
MKEFLSKLDFTYKPPNADALANKLLEDTYNTIIDQVNNELEADRYWNIVFDESKDISHYRIINLIICVALGAFFYGQYIIGAAAANVEWLRDWLLEKLNAATNNDLSVINSIATDICKTMFKIYDLLQASDEMRHAIYALCDSHGL